MPILSPNEVVTARAGHQYVLIIGFHDPAGTIHQLPRHPNIVSDLLRSSSALSPWVGKVSIRHHIRHALGHESVKLSAKLVLCMLVFLEVKTDRVSRSSVQLPLGCGWGNVAIRMADQVNR